MIGRFEPNPRKIVLEYFRSHRLGLFRYLLLLAVPAVISLIGFGAIVGLLTGISAAVVVDISANFLASLMLDWARIGASFLASIGFGTLLFFALWRGEVTADGLTANYWENRETRLFSALEAILRLAPFYWGIYLVSIIVFTLIAVLGSYLGARRIVTLVVAILIAAPTTVVPHALKYFLLGKQARQNSEEVEDKVQKPAATDERVTEGLSNWLIQFLAAVLKTRFSRFLVGFIILPILIIAAVWLPITAGILGLANMDAQRIGREGGTLRAIGPIQINFPAEAIRRSFWVKLDPIPRSTFLEGEVGRDLLVAAQNIPSNLTMLSRYYRIQHEGLAPSRVTASIRKPGEVTSAKLLDLYTWDGEKWQWLPSRLVSTTNSIETTLDGLPPSIVVMQADNVPLKMATDYHFNDPLPSQVSDILAEINPTGFQLGNGGRISGDPSALVPGTLVAAFDVVPMLRNWETETDIQANLINATLAEPGVRRRHIEAIVDLVQDNGYQGIELAYRGIDPNFGQAYIDFLEALREALPIDKQLSVWVELPQQVGPDRWETGAYDWQAIGRFADVVKIPPLPDPRAYVPGGQMEELLDWAIRQVNRSKLQPILRTHSVEQLNGISREISDQEALARLGVVRLPDGPTVATPGDRLDFTLDSPQIETAVQLDDDSGVYWFTYEDDDNTKRVILLENAATISDKLQFITQYNLRGVTLQGLLGPHTDPRTWRVIYEFPDLVIPPLVSKYFVVWRVESEATGSVLDQTALDLSQPNFSWSASTGGTFDISAGVTAGRNGSEIVSLGSVRLDIVAATPVPPPTPPVQTATPTPTISRVTPTPTATPTPTSQTFPEPTGTPQSLAPIAADSCPNLPRGEFVDLWQVNQEAFGCPIETEPLSGTFIEMSFERGHLFWVREIERYGEVRLVFATVGGQNEGDTGVWLLQPEDWAGQGICPVGPPPAGLFLPDRNLAKVWCDIDGLDLLGYATIPQEVVDSPGQAALQNFENVILLKDSQGDVAGLVYVLFRTDQTYVRQAY